MPRKTKTTPAVPASNPLFERVADALAELISSDATPAYVKNIFVEAVNEVGNRSGAFNFDGEHTRHVLRRAFAFSTAQESEQ
jgi:hypothetical protein